MSDGNFCNDPGPGAEAMSNFWASFDAMKPERPTTESGAVRVDDEAMQIAHEAIMPMYERIAQRGGFELADLGHCAGRYAELVTPMALAKLLEGTGIPKVLYGALQNVATEAFLRGVLWEQNRHMPALEMPDAPTE